MASVDHIPFSGINTLDNATAPSSIGGLLEAMVVSVQVTN